LIVVTIIRPTTFPQKPNSATGLLNLTTLGTSDTM
jgi:hypothetical protein